MAAVRLWVPADRALRERLAAAGRRVATSSDTEVVVRAHREWGRRDPRGAVRELVLMRDRLGIKPLYYYPTEHGVFCSEPKAILANSGAERVMDLDGLRRTLGFVADPRNAVIRGMREVPPGCVVLVSREGIQEFRRHRPHRHHTGYQRARRPGRAYGRLPPVTDPRLPMLLDRRNRMSMAGGLEVRVPLCTTSPRTFARSRRSLRKAVPTPHSTGR